MRPSVKLGGFKILRDVAFGSIIPPEKRERFPIEFCRLVAGRGINLPYFTCASESSGRGLDFVIDSRSGKAVSQLTADRFPETAPALAEAAILSIFPHKSNPMVMGSILDMFREQEIEPEAMAISSSAISIVLGTEVVDRAASALFGPFRFSAYRTPSDWKLAQKGKERLYKEVVASYQEKKPKVYGLEWRESLALLHVRLSSGDLGALGTAFRRLAESGLLISFLLSNPSPHRGEVNLFFCLPGSERNCAEMLRRLLAEDAAVEVSPVALFSMNGPHFGDRYGIAKDLLEALDRAQVKPKAFSCSIASITGVVSTDQVESTTGAIRSCFDVPSVIKHE